MKQIIPVGIIGTGSYVPDKIVTNKDLEKNLDTTDEWIRTKIGIRERRIAADDENTSDLATKASLKAIKSAGINPEDIGLIILATSTPDKAMPATASILQDKIHAVNAGAFDLMSVCSGFVYALITGSKFVADGTYKYVLVVASEVYSRILDWNDRTSCIFFGDGAGAVILGKTENGKGILSSHLMSDGSGSSVIEIPAGGTMYPATEESVKNNMHKFRMDGKAVWDFAVNKFPESVRNAINTAGLEIKDIDIIIPHQANINLINAGLKSLGISENKAYTNLDRYANTAAASIPIALDEALHRGKIRSGDIVVFTGFGGGLAWGSCVVKW